MTPEKYLASVQTEAMRYGRLALAALSEGLLEEAAKHLDAAAIHAGRSEVLSAWLQIKADYS